MRFVKVKIYDIEFEYQNYPPTLYDSVMRIGFSFPIHVIQRENRYICKDGHKRLSVLQDILQANPDYKRGNEVCVLIDNSDNPRSNDCWRGRNTH